jgi:signal transduction histidine kinase
LKLPYKIIAWSFVPTAFILLLVALTNYFAYQQVTEELVIDRDREVVRLTASEISASFEDYIDLLTGLARQPEIFRGDQQDQAAALASAGNRLALFDAGTYLLNNLGVVIASQPVDPELVGANWSRRSFFTSMVRNPGLYFSNSAPEGPKGENVLAIAVPVMGEKGEFHGVLAGLFHLDTSMASPFYGTLLKLRLGQDGQAFLLDANRRILFATSNRGSLSPTAILTGTELLTTGEIGALRTRTSDGRDIVAGYAPVPRTGWTLILYQEWSNLVRSSQNYRRFLILLLISGVVVPTIVVIFGVRRITGPIADFTAAARRLASGDFSQTIRVKTGDELEELANQFNIMASQLKESYEHLETRVAQRTQELTALNSVAFVVSQSLDLDQILPDALSKTIEVLGMEAGGVFRMAEDGESLILVGHQGISQRLIDLAREMPLETSIIAEVVKSKHPVSHMVSDYEPGVVRTILEEDGWQTVVSIPLLVQEQVLGAMNILSSKEVHFSPEELSVPASIGQQIGVAMDNARLYNQTLEYANQMEAARRSAEAANAAKSDFLANVSHELRTPLVSIYGFARLVNKRLNERIFPQLEKPDIRTHRVIDQISDNLEIILSESQRLTGLINNLLDLEKIESGKMEWQMAPIEAAEFISKAAAASAPLFEDGELQFEMDVPEQLGIINGDEDKLIQVLINLLSNAAKFTPSGRVTVQAGHNGAEIVISVVDEGPGIDPADQGRLFEKFVQVGDTMTKKPKGTGLGLAISKEIVERHGGRIWVVSERGKGSNFSFSLPLHNQAIPDLSR